MNGSIHNILPFRILRVVKYCLCGLEPQPVECLLGRTAWTPGFAFSTAKTRRGGILLLSQHQVKV